MTQLRVYGADFPLILFKTHNAVMLTDKGRKVYSAYHACISQTSQPTFTQMDDDRKPESCYYVATHIRKMKFKTIRQGEQAVVFNHLGEGRLVVGPQRLYLFRERIEFLNSYTATPTEYLMVKYNTGEIVHIAGPCEMFRNPMEQIEVQVKNGRQIDANHVLVVYRKRQKDNAVERRIVQGPTVFIPTAEEWLHNFEWHGPDRLEIGRMIPAKEKFNELACIPDQFYYNVRDVRTNDDTMLLVKLMVVYKLKDIIKMLEATHDPIADMINALCADVISFAGKHSFAEFLQNTFKLSDMESYPQLQQRAERIGYEISKVVYVGYKASDQLQQMQDHAIQSRTKLRLNAELEEQKQKLTDFKLTKQKDRTDQINEMERAKLEHAQKLAKLMQQQELNLKNREQEVQLQIEAMKAKHKLESDTAKSAFETETLQSLKNLNVDLTKYLVNQQGGPVSQEYRLYADNLATNVRKQQRPLPASETIF